MTMRLRRYEFSERLAEILQESQRDLRFRVTLMVSGGLIPPGPRGPGSPLASPDYAADLLIGVLAAPTQVHTLDAIRCYRELRPTVVVGEGASPGVAVGRPAGGRCAGDVVDLPLLPGRPRFGEALARLLAQATEPAGREALSRLVFGVWVARGFPFAALQLAAWYDGRRGLFTQRYELPDGARPPAWLDPERGGAANPGLFHNVFLPASKLIEIGRLTTPPEERTSPVLDNIGQTISNLAHLARSRRNRRPWEKFLSAAAPAQQQAEQLDRQVSRLKEVNGFGSNPGNLRMLEYVPDDLPPGAPLVVILHGCTQTATAYDHGTGWSELADRHGFALLAPEQRRGNNPLRCFNWFRAEDNARDSGEALSIRQMIDWMLALHALDAGRVHVTGLSAGAAMTGVMLATYPELFAGGAIVAGVPYRCAEGLQDAFEVIFQGRVRPAQEWGELVRLAAAHPGPWPRVSIWHGASDQTVKPVNADEIVKQWCDVHGLPSIPTIERMLDGHAHRSWTGPDGRVLVEAYSVAGMAHGQPIEPRGPDGCGNPAPYIVDAGISSPTHIARFWGLTETRREARPQPRPAAAAPRPQPRPAAGPEPVIVTLRPEPRIQPESSATAAEPAPAAATRRDVIVVDAAGNARAEEGPRREHAEHSAGSTSGGFAPGGVDIAGIISKSLELAGLAAGQAGPGRAGSPGGVDIAGIISKSFEMAGLARGAGDQAPPERGGGFAPGGVDIGAILRSSFEAAGLGPDRRGTTRPAAAAPASGPADREPASAAPGKPMAEATAEPPTEAVAATGGDEPHATPASAGSVWQGEGWRLVASGAGAPGEEPVLSGAASSGVGGDFGTKVRTVSRRLTLGPRPTLSYLRKLDLGAAVNLLTTASFTVLVDGLPVDEVAAVGMDYVEAEWTPRDGIDLARFAGRTVTLSFELAANSNVCQEVFAKAWLRGIAVHEDAPAEA